MGRSVTSSEPDVERAGEMTIEWSLRPQSTDDASAMRRIFLASRRATLDESGFDEATVERLTSYQFDLERTDFTMSHPAARWEAIVVDGDVVGRLVTDEDGDRTFVVDLLIDPLRRREGAGSAVLTQLIARTASRRIELDVDRGSAADAWFRKFGFTAVDDHAPRRRLVREPDLDVVAGTAA